jgi:hypothetical protein
MAKAAVALAEKIETTVDLILPRLAIAVEKLRDGGAVPHPKWNNRLAAVRDTKPE